MCKDADTKLSGFELELATWLAFLTWANCFPMLYFGSSSVT